MIVLAIGLGSLSYLIVAGKHQSALVAGAATIAGMLLATTDPFRAQDGFNPTKRLAESLIVFLPVIAINGPFGSLLHAAYNLLVFATLASFVIAEPRVSGFLRHTSLWRVFILGTFFLAALFSLSGGLIGSTQTATTRTWTLVSVVLAAVLTLLNSSLDRCLVLLRTSLMVFLYINIAGHFLGWQSAALQNYVGGLPPATGGIAQRILFPEAGGLASFGILAAIAGSLAWGDTVGRLRQGERLRRTSWARFVVDVTVVSFVLVGVNSRFVILGISITWILLLLPPMWILRIGAPLAVVALTLGLWLPVVTPYLVGLDDFSSENLQSITRISEDDFSTLNGRTEVWAAITNKLDDNVVNLLFGYGSFGQTVSGAVSDYSDRFTRWRDPESLSAHNTLLQIAIDTGVVGSAAFLLLLLLTFLSLIHLAKATGKESSFRMATGAVFVVVITAGTEATIAVTSYGFLAGYVFVLLSTWLVLATRTPCGSGNQIGNRLQPGAYDGRGNLDLVDTP